MKLFLILNVLHDSKELDWMTLRNIIFNIFKLSFYIRNAENGMIRVIIIFLLKMIYCALAGRITEIHTFDKYNNYTIRSKKDDLLTNYLLSSFLKWIKRKKLLTLKPSCILFINSSESYYDADEFHFLYFKQFYSQQKYILVQTKYAYYLAC